jgi:hypothetical protein
VGEALPGYITMNTIPLRADCAQCDALCCVALAFERSEMFAFDKPAGEPCPNLTGSGSCAIHRDLAVRGFPGCAHYDCLGAGQRITQMFAGKSWREGEAIAQDVFDAFHAMRRVHEMILLLREALRLPMSATQRARCSALLEALQPDTWTQESLRKFVQSEFERDARSFLRGLRDCVRA